MYEKPIEELITALTALPGIGQRSAQRLVFHILAGNQNLGHRINVCLDTILRQISECRMCRNFTTESLCAICGDERRDRKICVVETPADLTAVEQSGGYRGYYFVLHGKLSPMEGMGPDNLQLAKLGEAIKHTRCEEIILATNLTVEGEITAHYIGAFLRPFNLQLTRIAHGVPMGGELEYVDASTLARALSTRHDFSDQEPPSASVGAK